MTSNTRLLVLAFVTVLKWTDTVRVCLKDFGALRVGSFRLPKRVIVGAVNCDAGHCI
jgi:hypothetical protein